jgi:GINS complex subunit 4
MDWGRDYELLKSGGLPDEAGPSFNRHNENEEDPFGEPMAEDADLGVDDLLQEEESQGTPLEQLTRHWMNERHAPDILAAQEDLLTNLLDHLRRQVHLNVFITRNLNSFVSPVRSGTAPPRRPFNV